MKPTSVHKGLKISDEESAFQYLYETFRPSLKLWDYFVNWEKVFKNVREIEIQLNLWNVLIGKKDFDAEFLNLLTAHPDLVKSLPALVVRDGAFSSRFSVITNLTEIDSSEISFDFSKPALTQSERSAALEFVKGSGLERLFHSDGVKNLVDYVLGVEAGLDSNGRKNRSGTNMESVVGAIVSNIASKSRLDFLPQATQAKIRDRWDVNVPVDKHTRHYDFAIFGNGKLVLMETNFYGGGGSKLKATAGEYRGLSKLLNSQGFEFVWVTDGAGWKTTKAPLREAFSEIDHLWNLSLLNSGCLESLFV